MDFPPFFPYERSKMLGVARKEMEGGIVPQTKKIRERRVNLMQRNG